MDALELLKTDHKTVKELFKKEEASKNGKQQKQLFEEIKTESRNPYPYRGDGFLSGRRKARRAEGYGAQSLEEHRQVKTLLREMDNLTEESEKLSPS